MVYRFLNIAIDCDRFLLQRHNLSIGIEPRVLELIIYLVEQRHRMVPREELLRHVWNHQAVGPSVLTRAICLARKALDSGATIRTVHARGYQWITPVEHIDLADRRVLPQHAPRAQGLPPSS
jgi:DNA-binding winged helix-turn-helix (wHTH) protein